MANLFELEIKSFEVALVEARDRFEKITKSGESSNLTIDSFEYSNRLNFMLVGLCSLVEARLYEIVRDHKAATTLEEVSSKGLLDVQAQIKDAGLADFGNINNWDKFKCYYEIRNSIVHAYGGMVLESAVAKVEKAVKHLKIEPVLVGGRRIRFRAEDVSRGIDVVRDVLQGLGVQA